jgi:arylsulfate sulfotransferase
MLYETAAMLCNHRNRILTSMLRRLPHFGTSFPIILTLSCLSQHLGATIQVQLAPSPASPQPVGTIITWTATVSDSSAGAHEYQFTANRTGQPAAIVHDFNVTSSFQWAPCQSEGSFQIGVVARNTTTGETSQTSRTFTVTSRLQNGLAAVNKTAHPLVALFSAPGCTAGNFLRVRFSLNGSATSQVTNSVACTPTASENFYIAAMLPNSKYNMHYEVVSGSGTLVRSGANLTFTTAPLPTGINFPPVTVIAPAVPPTDSTYPILLHGYLPGGTSKFVPTATDLSGNVVWYYPHPVSVMPRTELGGDLLIMFNGQTDPHYQLLREIDLAGNITLETNVNRINEQLTALGRRTINAFHHEARRLSTGDIAVLGSDEMLVTNAQGGSPQNPVDILGAQVLILNSNLQLKWAWDAFDFLDLQRAAVLGEICTQGGEGCPVFFLAPIANDWLHANSIQLATDGSLMMSLRHQDWVIKIDYGNGSGTGSVIWRLGAGGDFSIVSNDPCPWFSHQHDANWQFGGTSVLSLFDNGNTRLALCDPGAQSRGMVLQVDQAAFQATPTLSANLGAFSVGLGTAEQLSNGNYHFEVGWILPGSYSNSVEMDPQGNTMFRMQEQSLTYRSYRMQDLYSPAIP